MTTDQFLWVLARVAGLSSYASLAIALVTGIALRTAILDWLGSNRAVRSLHEYTTVLWIPLAALHIVSLLLDATARVGLLDVVVPFHSTYGTLAIGLGALSLLTGIVMYKPTQSSTLGLVFGGYHGARLVHFLAMCGLLAFIPGHLVMVALHGWDNFASMLIGWKRHPEYTPSQEAR